MFVFVFTDFFFYINKVCYLSKVNHLKAIMVSWIKSSWTQEFFLNFHKLHAKVWETSLCLHPKWKCELSMMSRETSDMFLKTCRVWKAISDVCHVPKSTKRGRNRGRGKRGGKRVSEKTRERESDGICDNNPYDVNVDNHNSSQYTDW